MPKYIGGVHTVVSVITKCTSKSGRRFLHVLYIFYKHFNIGSRRESGTSERRRLPSPPQSTGHQLLVLSDLHLTPHNFEPTLHSLKFIKIYRFRYLECDDTAIQSIPVMG